MELPLSNTAETCKIDIDMLPWFKDKQLTLEPDVGVSYEILGHKFYVHEQVFIVGVKRGLKEMPQPGIRWRYFVRTRGGTARATVLETRQEEK